MKRTLLPACLLTLFAPSGEEISYGLEEGAVLTRTFEARAQYERDDIEVEVDGEEFPGVELPDYASDSLERVVVTDEILEVEDGRPTDFRRTFDELEQTGTYTVGEESIESENGSDLEGVTLRFLWDDDDEAFYVELDDEDDDVDDDVLEWLTADMDLAALLPDDEVDEDDSWEIDESAYLPLMWPGGLVGWYDQENEEEPNADSEAVNRQIIENLEGEGTATFVEVREEDDRRVAVLEMTLELTTEAVSERTAGDTDQVIEITLDMSRDIEGELLWDLDAGHLVSGSFETDSEYSRTEAFSLLDEEGGEHEIEQTEYYDGSIDYEVTVELE